MQIAILLLGPILLAAFSPARAALPTVRPAFGLQDYDKLSPFEAVRWKDDSPEVLLRGQWYTLVSIDDVAAKEIVGFAQRQFGDRWVKRFEEDLVEVMARMERMPPAKSRLALRDAEGRETAIEGVEWTRANRQAIWMAAKSRGAKSGSDVARALGRKDDDEYAKLSPFEAVRWQAEAPEVLVRGRWYSLRALDGVPAAEIVAFTRRQYGNLWIKRFEEDLVEVTTRMGHAPGSRARLELVDLESDAPVTIADVLWSLENRQAIWAAGRGRANELGAANEASLRRVSREHALTPAPAFAYLARAPAVAGGVDLTRAQAEQDLDQLEWVVENRFSYRDLAKVDYRAAFDALRSGLGDRIGAHAFGLQVAKLLALFGDGHTRLRGSSELLPRAFLPGRLEAVGERVAVLGPDGGLLDREHPYLAAIDGAALADWTAVAARYEPLARDASSARSLRSLAALGLLRLERGVNESDRAELDLMAADGKARATRKVQLAAAPVPNANANALAPVEARELDGSIRYLAIREMTGAAADLDELDTAMTRMRDTRGLVIDVRGNGGGSRDVMRRLVPYFMAADEPPYVVNVAAYRLPPGAAANAPEGYLADRGLYPAAWASWNAEERRAIDAVAATFRPSWTPPAGEFSDWHFCVIRRDENPAAYPYTKPVVVLMDEGCFSATDVFVGALQGRERVTLLGERSGGGSGRAETHVLTHSHLRVQLSTMASFRRDGRLYDRAGIDPDVHVEATLDDRLGKTDSQLDAALARWK